MKSMMKVIRPGYVVPIVLVAIAGTGLMLASLNNVSSSSISTSVSSIAEAPITPEQVDVALRRSGITPESLAASSLRGTAVRGLVNEARKYLKDNITALENADATFSLAKTNYDRLRRLVQQGKATPEQRQQLETFRQAAANARSSRRSLIRGLFDAVTASMDANQVMRLQILRDTTGWELPTQYLAMTGAVDSRPKIRDALANQRVSAKYGTSPNPGMQQFLARVNSRSDVVAARVGLDNTRSIELAWDNALNW